jgi:predicted phosphodiesterase
MPALTDTQRTKIKEVFIRVGNIQGVARELGHDRETVRRTIQDLITGAAGDALALGGSGSDEGEPQKATTHGWFREAMAATMREFGLELATPREEAPAPAPSPDNLKPTPPGTPAGLVYAAPPGLGRIVVLSDLHVPYHDVAAVDAALSLCEDWRPDLVIVNGDLYDSYLISSYEKEPGRLGDTLQGEFDAAAPITKRIDNLGCKVVMILGNHEARINALIAKNPGLAKLRALAWHAMAELPARWEILPQFSRYRLEHLDVHHGDLKQGPGGRYVAARMLEDLKRSSLHGHFHRRQFYAEPDGDGVVRGTFSQGHLCDEAEAGKYCRLNRWTKDFSTIDLDADTGLYEVRAHMIHKGRFQFQGKRYGG